MFWNKKEEPTKPDRFIRIIEPSLDIEVLGFIEKSFPGYRDEKMEKPKRLAFHEDVIEINRKLDLLIEHLNLQYVPEKESTEPAKFVEKPKNDGLAHFQLYINEMATAGVGATTLDNKTTKKRGRPKKK